MSKPYRGKKSASELLLERVERSGTPLSAMIEVADRCNETCVHCYQVQGQKGELATEDWCSILDRLAALGVLFLTISGGEATLRGDFLELVEAARARSFVVKLYTNALTMTPELARALADRDVAEVQISLYSARAEVHDFITRVQGSFDRTTAGVRALRAVGIPVLVKTPLFSLNSGPFDRDAYLALAASLDAEFAFDPSLDAREDGDRSPGALALSDAALVEVLSDERLYQRDPVRGQRPLEEPVCGACQNVHVEAHGELRPCTSLGVGLGDARTTDLRAAYREGGVARAMRGTTWGHLHGCRDCDLRAHCARCFATAAKETGDAHGPYPQACQLARANYAVSSKVNVEVQQGERADCAVGPYVVVEAGLLRTVEHRLTEADLARREEAVFGRFEPGPAPALIAAGALVRVQRPGGRIRVESVPVATTTPSVPASPTGPSAAVVL